MKTQTIGLLVLGLGLFSGSWAGAEEDRMALEASLFSDEEGASETATADLIPASEVEPKTVGFSGEITSAVVDRLSNTLDANTLYTYTVGNIFLDARMPRQAKVFANLEATYFSQQQATDVALRELFLDFNLSRSVYFRAGKQVLQWGRCYLWNPTDLINVERRQFIQKIGYREGAYGFKAHAPFGTQVNLYSFIDVGQATDAENTAGALKAEFLLGNVEVAFSGWGKKGQRPIWGFDFSARPLGIDTLGEISAGQGMRPGRVRIEDGQLVVAHDEGAWMPKAALDFSRSFTVGDFKDRLTFTLEGYYDRAGHETNPFSDSKIYPFAEPVIPDDPMTPAPVVSGTQKDFIRLNELHQTNTFSRAYVALFTTFSRFILSDLTLGANGIYNLIDHSGIASLSLTYVELNSFTAGLMANAYLGPADSEYTYQGNKTDLQLTLGISF